MSKKNIYLLGLITLIGFPLLGILILWFFSGIEPLYVLELNSIFRPSLFLGIFIGIVFAKISLILFNTSFFKEELSSQMKMILDLKLNFWDKIFLSFCAGFGEEILFRSSIQHYLGIWLTTFIFIAIHGYLNPKNWKISLYGLYLFPVILIMGAGFSTLGLWFSIAMHFSYDLILFMSIKEEEEGVFFKKYRV
jgi:membrane protease YdiL (CAAX protease family)